jgi:hypothetical protein
MKKNYLLLKANTSIPVYAVEGNDQEATSKPFISGGLPEK